MCAKVSADTPRAVPCKAVLGYRQQTDSGVGRLTLLAVWLWAFSGPVPVGTSEVVEGIHVCCAVVTRAWHGSAYGHTGVDQGQRAANPAWDLLTCSSSTQALWSSAANCTQHYQTVCSLAVCRLFVRQAQPAGVCSGGIQSVACLLCCFVIQCVFEGRCNTAKVQFEWCPGKPRQHAVRLAQTVPLPQLVSSAGFAFKTKPLCPEHSRAHK